MKGGYQILIALFSLFLFSDLYAQHSFPDTIKATLINEKVNFDGRLSESFWQTSPSISNFTQRELDFGKKASEQTKVAMVYDNLALYIGVWCYQKQNTIHAKFMERDFDYTQDDNFEIALSSFKDKRNGYLFIINPNGARADLLVAGSEEGNKDWNGVWDAKTSITNEGWFAELRIPFNSLQFKNDSTHNWDINFERDIRYNNEQDMWQGWTRDCSIFCFVNAGTLSGLKNIGYAKRFEFKPFALGTFEKADDNTLFDGKIGGDLNVNLTPTLK
jgi:hypothetical protein